MHSFHITIAQSCSVWRWAKCAAAVAGCAAACIDPLDPVCVACLGPSYQECRPCIGLAGTINGLVTLQGEQCMNNISSFARSATSPSFAYVSNPAPGNSLRRATNASVSAADP